MPLDAAIVQAYKQNFLPYGGVATDRAQALGCKFAYYTTAATAIQILQRREMWMRSTLVMNDFSEVRHGLSCVLDAYKAAAGSALKSVLEKIYKGICQEIEQELDAWMPTFQSDTFVLCLSEHPEVENRFGRLSMWRAYGGNAGVALVLNGDVLFRPSDALAAYSSPVAYLDELAMRTEIQTLAASIEENPSIIRQLGREKTKMAVFHMLRFAAISTKHPAFSEEREWRVLASPTLEFSSLLRDNIEVIGGIPQRVLKITLADCPEKGLTGLTPECFIERILIGPCEHPEVIRQSICRALELAGVPNPLDRIFFTGIPLRANQR